MGELEIFLSTGRHAIACVILPDVGFDTWFLAFDGPGVHRYVYSLKGSSFLRVEILYKSGICVQIRSSRVPMSKSVPTHQTANVLTHQPTITSLGFTR